MGFALSLSACMGPPEEAEGTEPGAQPVECVQQSLPSSGWTRTYYSDSTRTTVVGYEQYDCDPDYRSFEGESSLYYNTYYYDCPGFDSPAFPQTKCMSCKTATSCVLVSC
ncbi:hypothetical protein D187_006187 [Cystobacter fuscus DSM 2262]|uniref:Uncharacterized protein n=1 Tax=Cystobacter fuscus (strain ATCC 25194 / DSM 2262 / NBRC 100088 / M29) TaxID=1242864 RepID=S9R4F8_CYSF2|nr:hypothetical protein [Cystobacter fuscus]EPX63778.1 hypothetical protein D187_006187 [Cystobacter fuscus DSM 2262]